MLCMYVCIPFHYLQCTFPYSLKIMCDYQRCSKVLTKFSIDCLTTCFTTKLTKSIIKSLLAVLTTEREMNVSCQLVVDGCGCECGCTGLKSFNQFHFNMQSVSDLTDIVVSLAVSQSIACNVKSLQCDICKSLSFIVDHFFLVVVVLLNNEKRMTDH